MRVIAIWEPILTTDWRSPTTSVLARLSDRRVRQFWDKPHIMALRMAHDAHPPQPHENCCERSGVLWDLAAIYPPGARWNERLPSAVVFDGPVVRITPKIEATLTALESRP